VTSTAPDEISEQPSIPLLEPVGGTPPVLSTAAELADAIERLAEGSGPIAFDAERASGYRYSQRAYLVQLRRHGSGSFLIDPIALPELAPLAEVIGDQEWVLHAASQDLPCLAEIGLIPERIFDTELAGRLAGFERVGLAAMVERVLGYGLEKGHSAADWSTRPLPDPWLRYAALDVELLVELRDALESELRAQGKLEWAHEEFAAVLAAPPKEPRAEPWRRTSGIHRVRNRRQLGAVRALWESRDELARTRDVAPGRLLPDSAIVNAVLEGPADVAALTKLPVFSGPRQRTMGPRWFGALTRAATQTDRDLPTMTAVGGEGLPPANRWAERDPAAAGRLTRVRAALAALSEQYDIPVENLLEPALSRRLAWAPAGYEVADVSEFLRGGNARAWQVGLVAEPLTEALQEPAPESEQGPAAESAAD
jgi:ribonuclease D